MTETIPEVPSEPENDHSDHRVGEELLPGVDPFDNAEAYDGDE